MRHRCITKEEARHVWDVLVECLEMKADPAAAANFIRAVTDDKSPCHEYRLNSTLGFGGKFRNNGNYDGIPYVDCYPEDLTPTRTLAINRANQQLRKLFE